jgi:hypothetical protein
MMQKTKGPEVKVAPSIPTHPNSLLHRNVKQGVHFMRVNEKMSNVPTILTLTASHKAKGQDKVPT